MTNLQIGDLIESQDAKGIYEVDAIKEISEGILFTAVAIDVSCEFASIGGNVSDRLTIIV